MEKRKIEMHEPHDEHVKAYDINHFKNRKRTKPVTTLKGLKMKDDNLSDTQQQNVGKILQCEICDNPKPDPKLEVRCLNCAGKLFYIDERQTKKGIRPEDEKALKAAYKYESVLARNIWNEAIEAAALIVNNSDGFLHAETIRKLKK